MAAASWDSWKVLLIAAAGEALTDAERIEFQRLTGREREPGVMIREFVGVLGRRSGQNFCDVRLRVLVAALCEHRHVLSPGETGIALLISRDQRVAKIILGYIEGVLSQSEQLRQLIVNRTQDTIELSNNVWIEVRPCNYRTLRGMTCVAIVGDEVAQWFTSADFANPDEEVLTAVRPTLMTTRGPLLMVSSAYARRGVLYDSYRRYFGPSGPDEFWSRSAPAATPIRASLKPRSSARLSAIRKETGRIPLGMAQRRRRLHSARSRRALRPQLHRAAAASRHRLQMFC